MSANILFDNIVITDNEVHANSWADATFTLKKAHLDKESVSLRFSNAFSYNLYIN